MLINNLFCWPKSQRWSKKASMSVFMLATLFFHTPAAAVFDTSFPEVQRRFDTTNGKDYGLSDVDNMNELLRWGDDFYKCDRVFPHEETSSRKELKTVLKNRMENVLSQRESVKKIIDICYAGTSASPIPGLLGTGTKDYRPNEVLLENTDNGQKFVRILMSMHICFGRSKGKVEPILKIFLGRGNLIFMDDTTVQQVRDGLTLNEQYYVMLVRKSFLQHIAKHWIYETDTVDFNAYNGARHKQKSGFVSFPSQAKDFPHPEEYAVDVLLSNPELLNNLKILKTNGGDLTISTVDGLSGGSNIIMFEMASRLFQKRVKDHALVQVFALSHKVEDDGHFEDEECLNPAEWNGQKKLQRGRVTLSKQRQDKLKCFFKFTLPNDICFHTRTPTAVDYTPVPLWAGAYSSRLNSMGSFYVRSTF